MSISLSLKFTLQPFIIILQCGRKYLVFLVYLHCIGFLDYLDYYDFNCVCFSYLGLKKHSIKTNNSQKKKKSNFNRALLSVPRIRTESRNLLTFMSHSWK